MSKKLKLKLDPNYVYHSHLFVSSVFLIKFLLFFCGIAGRKAYSLTWVLQYVNLFMINVGYIILAGQALKVSPVKKK